MTKPKLTCPTTVAAVQPVRDDLRSDSQLCAEIARLREDNARLREALEFMLRVGPSGIIGQQFARELAISTLAGGSHD